jgi:hypothetical protein
LALPARRIVEIYEGGESGGRSWSQLKDTGYLLLANKEAYEVAFRHIWPTGRTAGETSETDNPHELWLFHDDVFWLQNVFNCIQDLEYPDPEESIKLDEIKTIAFSTIELEGILE